MDKRIFKKSPEELEGFLMWRRRGYAVPAKKGRGSKYNRKDKHKGRNSDDA